MNSFRLLVRKKCVYYMVGRQLTIAIKNIRMENKTEDYLAPHYVQRSNWLRAAVLGANDGILSTSSLAIGVTAASELRAPVVLATVAGLVAGALSMAAGEYVSVSSKPISSKPTFTAKRKNCLKCPSLNCSA